MNNEGTTKASKDKSCPYCGQAFTSSSLGRHLDLYIKNKNPKAPDGIHNVDEIRKLRGSITRRQPRGGGRRDTSASAARSSQAGSKTSPAASDADSFSVTSPGTPMETQPSRERQASRVSCTEVFEDIDHVPHAGDGNHAGAEATRSTNSQRVFNRQIIKSSMDVKQRVQDALDTAKASELALREIIGSWRAAKQQVDGKSRPFNFNPLSLDFPALCLQCLEPPPTLFSSTPHPTSTSWSITPPGERQREALWVYFQEEFRKWKISCSAAATATVEELTYPPSQAAAELENSRHIVREAEKVAELLERQVTEHLASAFQVWEQLPAQRQQELWVLEMARSIGTKQKEVNSLREAQYSLKQDNTNLKSQIDHLNRLQQPREFKVIPPMTMKVDEKMVELWTEAGASGRRVAGLGREDRHSDLSTVVSGAIERWKNVIVTTRAASGMGLQKPLDQTSGPLKTPVSAIHPMTPGAYRSTQQQHFHAPESSPQAQSSIARNTSVSSGGSTASEPKTSAASTPAQSPAESEDENNNNDNDDDDDDDDDDADADADVEMEGGNEYLSTTNTPTHHGMTQLPQHPGPQAHQMHPVNRSQEQQHMPGPRHNQYPPRSNTYGMPGLLPSQHIHMGQQAFGHQMQNLEQHLAQGHGATSMGWNSH